MPVQLRISLQKQFQWCLPIPGWHFNDNTRLRCSTPCQQHGQGLRLVLKIAKGCSQLVSQLSGLGRQGVRPLEYALIVVQG